MDWGRCRRGAVGFLVVAISAGRRVALSRWEIVAGLQEAEDEM